ncbi:hypothetical protein [Porphyromonas loveana]|uniref:hypothetical protein n=1 Tax=Porphyromonas loveana TaxID=1884669 RepID=UPI0035A0E8C9
MDVYPLGEGRGCGIAAGAVGGSRVYFHSFYSGLGESLREHQRHKTGAAAHVQAAQRGVRGTAFSGPCADENSVSAHTHGATRLVDRKLSEVEAVL